MTDGFETLRTNLGFSFIFLGSFLVVNDQVRIANLIESYKA